MITHNLTLGSLFDGIGGFPYAATFYGITPVWASEVDPRCISVTQHHFPDMEHVGDITELDGAKLTPVDIITFGSPCQDLSVAGRRAGLQGERSGLFWEAIRIIDEMRGATNGKYPKWAIWENVPGALSSGKGADFATVLSAFTKTEVPLPPFGKWANAGMVRGNGIKLAWCVYNAQYFGVPQRRRRIFLIANFTDECAGEILFVPKSLSGYFAARSAARKTVAANAVESISPPIEDLNKQDRIAVVHPDASAILCTSSAGTSHTAETGSEVDFCVTYAIQATTIGRKGNYGSKGLGVSDGACYTLTTGDPHAVCYRRSGFAGYEEGIGTLLASGGAVGGGSENLIVTPPPPEYIVRRLTPMECERLQGFPDHWTAIEHKGKPMSDTARYMMLGNSVAIPCVAYIFQGIVSAHGDNV